ncbi:hypothetical protein [Acutalibacter sp. JLR.KK004]|uniref:hypothetical protein n=1 Tax=Acutalibacter sp. JLR.KK004 TaxID=3112622 RepID=UPI002FEF02ED
MQDIAIAFASGLVNLSAKQDEQGALDTIERLEQLVEKHSGVQDIAIAFAKGLVNLSCKQDEQKALSTIERIKALAAKHPGNGEIAHFLNYAQNAFDSR